MKSALALLILSVILPSGLSSCSSVTYKEGHNEWGMKTVTVTRRDFGRDVDGEYLKVEAPGFKYGSKSQNESETATSLIDSLERFGETWAAMKALINGSDNAASVDNTAVQQAGTTDRTQIRATESTTINRDREVTKRLALPD